MNVLKASNHNTLESHDTFNFSEIENIVAKLKALNEETALSDNEDLKLIINSAFNLCFVSYYLALRLLHDK